MSIAKKFLQSRPVCKVSFRLEGDHVNGAETVSVVGDFNDWDPSSHPMRKLKKGGFSLTMDLPVGREYQFRYLMDGELWANDGEADRYQATPYGNGENCILVL